MCMTNEAAAIKLAERDNLVGELVGVLQEAHALLTNERIGTWQYMESSQFYSDANGVAQKIAAVLAKAREGAQS